MTHWQRRAQNKASEDRRKGHKQGIAIVDYMRRTQDEREREISVQKDQEMAGLPLPGDQATGSEVRTAGDPTEPQDSPASPPRS